MDGSLFLFYGTNSTMDWFMRDLKPFNSNKYLLYAHLLKWHTKDDNSNSYGILNNLKL